MTLKISTKEEIQEYFDSPYLSQSELKMYLGTREEILHRMNKKRELKRILFADEAQHNLIGTAVDIKLTGTENMFDDLFYVTTVEKPSELVSSIIKNAILIAKENNKTLTYLNNLQNEIITACNNHKYQPNWKDETKIESICEYYDYFNDLIVSDSKHVITIKDLNLIDTLVNNFIDQFEYIFNRESIDNNPNIEIYYQKPIYFKFKDQDCKALIDILIHNKITNEITIIDIKTTSDLTSEFVKSYYKFGYNYQMAFYKKAVEYYYVDTVICKFLVGSKLSNYVNSFVVSKESIEKTTKGLNTRHLLEIDKSGEISKGQTKEIYEGIYHLINKYKYYKNNNFEYNYDLNETIIW